MFLDDRVIIPDDIKNMTHEEQQAEIARMEKEAKEKRTKQKQAIAL